jgi:hypothetical protein
MMVLPWRSPFSTAVTSLFYPRLAKAGMMTTCLKRLHVAARRINFVAPTSPRPRYSKEEFARRGDEIYERDVLPRLTSEDEGKYALIDIETGDYEIDRDEIAASDRLFARKPDAQVWFRQIGSRYARRFGPRFKTTAA